MASYTTQILIDIGQAAQGERPGYIFSDGWSIPRDVVYTWLATPNKTKSDQSFKFQVNFTGTHLLILGGGPSFHYSIDSSPKYTSTPSGTNWIQDDNVLLNTTILDDTKHSITASDFTGSTSVWEAFIAPGPKTPLDSRTLLQVDDTDPSIVYHGQWAHDPPKAMWLEKSRHTTTHVGDSIIFGFCGSFASVWGEWDYRISGSLTLGFIVDNGTMVSQTWSTPQTTGYWDKWQYFNTTNTLKTTGDCQHTINVTLLGTSGSQFFSFAFFRYTPSFNTFGEAPQITVAPFSSSSSSSSLSSSYPSGTSSSVSSSHHKSSHVVGPAVGGAIGGLLVLSGIILAIILLRRRKRKSSAVAPGQMKQQDVTRFSTLPQIQEENQYDIPSSSGNPYTFSPIRRTQPPVFTPAAQNNLSYVPPSEIQGRTIPPSRNVPSNEGGDKATATQTHQESGADQEEPPVYDKKP